MRFYTTIRGGSDATPIHGARLDSEHEVRINTNVLSLESSRGGWWGQLREATEQRNRE